MGKRLYLLLFGSLLLAILVFLLPTYQIPENPSIEASLSGESWDDDILSCVESIEGNQKSQILGFLKAFENETTSSNKLRWIDSVLNSASSIQNGWLIALSYEKIAEIKKSSSNWLDAGNSYYKFAVTPSASSNHFVKAIACYQNAEKLQPLTNETKVDLAICYIEGSKSPMQGIQLFKDVIENDPKHVSAHMNMGYYCIKSGQYEKAVERFNHLLTFDHENNDVYLYLAEAHLKLGNKNEAISNLEKFKSSNNDPARLKQVEKYLEEINRSNS